VTELVLIRHGETDWNRAHRFQGQLDVPLNAAGQAQAEALARHAADLIRGDAFFSSDLQRAQQTAAPLAAIWGQAPVLLPGLREQAFGEWEGQDVPTLRARHPREWARWLEHDEDHAPPGGETARQFHARVWATVQTLVSGAGPRQRIVIVTHGGVLDVLWRTAHGRPLSGPREAEIPNGGINRLRWQVSADRAMGGRLEVDDWADISHLQGLAPPLRP
jgi:2,3-bisphosphoglycerate-dependent phosphoglycerate mutase